MANYPLGVFKQSTPQPDIYQIKDELVELIGVVEKNMEEAAETEQTVIYLKERVADLERTLAVDNAGISQNVIVPRSVLETSETYEELGRRVAAAASFTFGVSWTQGTLAADQEAKRREAHRILSRG